MFLYLHSVFHAEGTTLYIILFEFSSDYSSKFPKDFSTSCRAHFERYLLSQKPKCLLQAPIPTNIMTTPVCGNHLLEVGEDCDCGSPKVLFIRFWLGRKNYAVFFLFSNILLEILSKDKLRIIVKSRFALVFLLLNLVTFERHLKNQDMILM